MVEGARQGAPAGAIAQGIDQNACAPVVAGRRVEHRSRNLAGPMSYRLTDARANTAVARTYVYADTWSTGTTHSVARHANTASPIGSLRHDRAYTTGHDTATLSGLIT